MKGVLDRFEDDKAVILIETEKMEIIVDKNKLPDRSDVSTWFDIEKQNEDYKLTIDSDKTKQMKQKSADLRAKLQAKSSGSKFLKK